MKNKKFLVAAGALVLGVSTLASCGSKTDLLVWCASEDVPFVEKVVENFKKDNEKWAKKNIKVAITNEPDATPLLKADPKASADVFHFTGDSLGELVKQELLYEIDADLFASHGITENLLSSGNVGGKQYGIPFTPNTYFMYYDASVYSAEDVKSFEKMIAKDVSKNGYEYNFALDLANGWYLQSYYFSNGCEMYKPEGNITPRDRALESTHWIWEYLHNDKLYSADGSAECGIKNAACVTGTWNAAKIKEQIENHGGTYAAAPLPMVDFGNGPVAWKSVRDFKQVGVNSTTTEPELACELAAYLTNKESQKLRYDMRKTSPTSDELINDPAIEWDAAIVAQNEQLEHTFIQPREHSTYWDAATALGSDLKKATELEIEDWFDRFLEGMTVKAE